jgi:hypothetical protein
VTSAAGIIAANHWEVTVFGDDIEESPDKSIRHPHDGISEERENKLRQVRYIFFITRHRHITLWFLLHDHFSKVRRMDSLKGSSGDRMVECKSMIASKRLIEYEPEAQ